MEKKLKEKIISIISQFKFKKGMTWANYGSYWHVDHGVPISWFNFESYDDPEFKECWALDNLKPMERIPNIRKGNRYAEPTLHKFLNEIKRTEKIEWRKTK